MSTPRICVNPVGYQNPYIRRKRNPFNDKRLEEVWKMYDHQLLTNKSCSINKVVKSVAQGAAIRRFFSNERVEVAELIELSCQIDENIIENQQLVIYGDTSNFSLKKLISRLKDPEKIGVLDDNKSSGFHSHVNLVAKRDNTDILGLSDIQIWSRPQVLEGKTNSERENLKFEEKESSKWSLGVSNSMRVLKSASHCLFVFDSEADVYENFEHILKHQNVGFVIRSKYNRKTIWQDQTIKLYDIFSKIDALGTYKVELPELKDHSKFNNQKNRKKRTATIELRSIAVNVHPPVRFKNSKNPIKLFLIEAKEVTRKLPANENSVLWRLWTTMPTKTFEEAKEVVNIYKGRWNIEQLFRTAKRQGFDIESTQLRTFEGILKQTVMVLKNSAVVMQLVKARGNENASPIVEVFSDKEIEVLDILNTNLEGKTELQKNKYPKDKLSWAAWVIARLGGWKGYESSTLPGPITFARGLERFLFYVDAKKLFNST